MNVWTYEIYHTNYNIWVFEVAVVCQKGDYIINQISPEKQN